MLYVIAGNRAQAEVYAKRTNHETRIVTSVESIRDADYRTEDLALVGTWYARPDWEAIQTALRDRLGADGLDRIRRGYV